MRFSLLAIGLLFALLHAANVSAQEGAPRVALYPIIYASPSLSVDTPQRVADGVSRHLVADPAVDWVSREAALAEIRNSPTYEANVQVARDWVKLGKAKYRQLDSAGAIRDLGQGYEKFLQAGHDFVAPREVAEVLQFSSLAMLEQGTAVSQPLEAMASMIELEPTFELRRGAYPDEVVQFYEGARLTVEAELRERGPDAAKIARFAELADVDFVVAVAVVATDDANVIVTSSLWDAAEQSVASNEAIELRELDEGALADAANRLASRHVVCLREPVEATATTSEMRSSQGTSPVALQFGAAYGSYYEFPQVSERDPIDPFAQLGASLAANFFLTNEFALMGMFQFLNAQKDYDGQIQSGFNTLRWFLGAELGITFGKLRLSVAPLLEMTRIGEIRYCRGIDSNLSLCEPRNRDPDNYLPLGNAQFVIGVNARPRVSFEVATALGLFVAGSSSFYFAQDDARDPNYLTNLEAGFSYRF